VTLSRSGLWGGGHTTVLKEAYNALGTNVDGYRVTPPHPTSANKKVDGNRETIPAPRSASEKVDGDRETTPAP